ncbi:hypothetical protein [Streptomyces sp. NPDC049590]|uniref:MmyB family transcriptional regulator n=1 Tax=Streptomyces sp. NPDC049590 TaxID=3154834 RepID=UPI003430FD6D
MQEGAGGCPARQRYPACGHAQGPRNIPHTHGSEHFHHPIVGPLTLDHESLTTPAHPDQRLSVHTAEAGSSSEEALRLCAPPPVSSRGKNRRD